MIWSDIQPDERLRLWKDVRSKIDNHLIDYQLNEIARFCAEMPFGARTLDYYTPENWPSPWEILYNGTWCTNSISLLIFYTFTLLPTYTKNIELLLVEDSTDRYLLPFIDDRFILNYELGHITKWCHIKDNFKIINRYSRENIKIIT